MSTTIDTAEILRIATDYLDTAPANRFRGDVASEWVERRIFATPLLGVAAAGDPLFAGLKAPEAVGPHSALPTDWLPAARSVVSLFLPFTAEVCVSNIPDAEWPSWPWLYGRIEGQACVNDLLHHAAQVLRQRGAKVVAPSLDDRLVEVVVDSGEGAPFARSSWSERHVAYIAGLGTFGLSKGLITEAGVAGRLGSLVTDLPLPATPRHYAGLYDHCTHCGACIRRCPVDAITQEGKRHGPCSEFLRRSMQRYASRYGCGKCQTGVPCMARIPTP